MLKNSLATICFEQISDKYYYGLFGDFKLIIDTESDFFNATKLCNDSGKHLRHWLENKHSKGLIKHLYDSQNSDYEIFKTVKGGRDEIDKKIISGTYLPKQLILSIASWISHEFYLKVYNIIENYFIRDFQEKYENDSDKLRNRVVEIESENDRLQSKLARVELQYEHLENEKRLLDTLISEFQNQSANFRDDVAPKTDREDTLNTLVVVRKNADGDGQDGSDGSSSSSSYPYYAVRCQRRTRARAMRNLRKRYPEFEVALEIAYNPNAVNLYNRARERLRYAAFRANHLRVSDFERFTRDLEELVPKLI